jgi:hypothetical protein
MKIERAFALAILASCHRAPKTETPKPQVPDAGVADASPPDAEVPDAAPPPTITFAPAPWSVGQQVRVWHRATLSGVPGSADITSQDELTFTVTGPDFGGVTATIGTDCTASIARGTAKVRGDCGGDATGVAYKLDLAAQLLAVPRGTMAVGDACTGFGRPLVGLFRLQDAGAIVTSHLAAADDHGATYAVHAELDGLMLRPGLHVQGELDGEIHVDAGATAMTGTLRADRVMMSGYPQADFSAKGALELDFGVAPN